ncbi:crossover junction endodeoxyribonuclease RuvC [Treponema primitia]|uniref:crossover junction endodeoxyribonuclease RuvC n=1 Tax=Treponema primitia TaxID=88058 RepID=UPI0002555708|nr:crossover junction endodeoxyribonuclease RuvC [Treponema primitia]
MSRSKKSGLLALAGQAARTGKVRRILGVDPGLSSVGWGLVEIGGSRIRHIAHGCIETKADRPQAERLFSIYTAFKEVLAAYEPAESAMETLYFARNVSSAMPVAEARGVLGMALAEWGLRVREFTPNAIKQAVTGAARADKSQVQEMVRFILGLEDIPKPDHAADALASAICAAHTLFLE